MIFRTTLLAFAFTVASPVLAWSGSTQAGDYRITATLDNDAHLQSVSLAPQSGLASKPMQLHAWFVDSEGAILAPAPLATANASGRTLVALGKGAAVPATASALVVLAQPAGLTRTAMAASPAVVAQIALP
ncbi:MAG TPA: hypothetical protein VK533_04920 [Sphingomonas sp.]|uniref:hypothetical protein n=1 Tax=Sphingomonas sp. TaxID=28214 RepID=UPI002D02FAB8|nr:hypothetical protein [Sphingomonas sp.]HMI18866.1 hypothetical protein [Sphingomonas sp.]